MASTTANGAGAELQLVISELDLSNNALTGAVDLGQTLCGLSFLRALKLGGNPGLSGSQLAPAAATARDQRVGCVASALSGGLPLIHLRYVDVAGNGLVGTLPLWLAASMQTSEAVAYLAGNDFDAPSAWEFGGNVSAATVSTGEQKYLPVVSTIVNGCRGQSATSEVGRCTGLPPKSCSAFGDHYRVRTDNPLVCTYCDPRLLTGSIAALVAVGLMGIGLLSCYVAVVKRYRNSMKRWVSTISLFFAHLQMLGVYTNLSLEWPPRVRDTASLLAFSVAETTLVRSECLVEVTNPYFVISFGQVVLTCAVLVGGGMLACDPARILPPQRRDRFWFVLSIIVQFTFASSWRLCYGLLHHVADGNEYVLGGIIAALLLAYICLIIVVLLLSVAASYMDPHKIDHITSQKGHVGGGGSAFGRCTWRFWTQLQAFALWAFAVPPLESAHARHAVSNLALTEPTAREKQLKRLEVRVEYLTQRYAKHAPYWQFVVWARQLALMTVASVARAVHDNHDEATVQIGLVWAQAVIALLILSASFWLHRHILPYEFAFQNEVESWLFGANLAMLLLAMIYTGLGQVEGFAYASGRDVVEDLMFALVVTATVGSAARLIVAWRNGMKTQQEVESARRLLLGSSNHTVRIRPSRPRAMAARGPVDSKRASTTGLHRSRQSVRQSFALIRGGKRTNNTAAVDRARAGRKNIRGSNPVKRLSMLPSFTKRTDNARPKLLPEEAAGTILEERYVKEKVAGGTELTTAIKEEDENFEPLEGQRSRDKVGSGPEADA